MKELVLHLGIPKTGSSALQVFLARNHAALLARGVDYLRIGEFMLGVEGRISAGNGAYLARTMLPADAPAHLPDAEHYWAEFRNAVARSTARIGIVSSELFVDARREALEALIAGLGEDGITVRALYYIRRQDQFLASSYMQQVKRHACTESPESYARTAYRQHPYLGYHSFYRYFCGIFGADNILCRVYEGALTRGSGLFRDVLGALGIAAEGLAFAVPDINTSLTPKDAAIMLLINRHQPRMQFSDLVVENAVRTGAMQAGIAHNILPRWLIAEVEAHFREENQAMARDYFKREQLFASGPGAGLADPPAPQSISSPALTLEDVISFFGGLLVRYDQRLAALEQRIGEISSTVHALRAGHFAPETAGS
jgi:hypothetical protein